MGLPNVLVGTPTHTTTVLWVDRVDSLAIVAYELHMVEH